MCIALAHTSRVNSCLIAKIDTWDDRKVSRFYIIGISYVSLLYTVLNFTLLQFSSVRFLNASNIGSTR